MFQDKTDALKFLQTFVNDDEMQRQALADEDAPAGFASPGSVLKRLPPPKSLDDDPMSPPPLVRAVELDSKPMGPMAKHPGTPLPGRLKEFSASKGPDPELLEAQTQDKRDAGTAQMRLGFTQLANAFTPRADMRANTSLLERQAMGSDEAMQAYKERRASEEEREKKQQIAQLKARKADANSIESRIHAEALQQYLPNLDLTGKSSEELDRIMPLSDKLLIELSEARRRKDREDEVAKGRAEKLAAEKKNLEDFAVFVENQFGLEPGSLKGQPKEAIQSMQAQKLRELEETSKTGHAEEQERLRREREERERRLRLEDEDRKRKADEKSRIDAEGRAETRKQAEEKRKLREEQRKQVQEINYHAKNIRDGIAQLRKLVEAKGTYEALGAHSKELEQQIQKIAIADAKLSDPTSAAKEGEVALARKKLFDPGLGTRNTTALDILAAYEPTVDAMVANAYAVRPALKGLKPGEAIPEDDVPAGMPSRQQLQQMEVGAVFEANGKRYRVAERDGKKGLEELE